jgi:hypothetical protein
MKKIVSIAFVCSLLVLSSSAVMAAPIISVTPSSVAFGQVPLFAIASTGLTVTNTGDEELQIFFIRTWAPFLDSEAYGCILAPGQYKKMQVGFAPTAVGQFSSSCSFMSNAQNASVLNVPLTGEGTN